MSDADVIWDVYESPIGPLTLIAGDAGLRGLWFPGKTPAPPEAARRPLPAVTEQLEAYFQGELRAFDLDLDLRGAPLDREVWRASSTSPTAKTESYGELAARVDPDALPGPRRTVAARPHGRRRERPQPGLDHRPLPPGDRRRRLADRLRRRPPAQAGAARAGGFGPSRSGLENPPDFASVRRIPPFRSRPAHVSPQRAGNLLRPDATSGVTLPRNQGPVSRIQGPKNLGAGEPILGRIHRKTVGAQAPSAPARQLTPQADKGDRFLLIPARDRVEDSYGAGDRAGRGDRLSRHRTRRGRRPDACRCLVRQGEPATEATPTPGSLECTTSPEGLRTCLPVTPATLVLGVAAPPETAPARGQGRDRRRQPDPHPPLHLGRRPRPLVDAPATTARARSASPSTAPG